MINADLDDVKRPDNGTEVKFTGNETFSQFKEKLEKQFNVTASAVKLGRRKDNEINSFDGLTLLQYTSERKIFPSRHKVYLISADEDEDSDYMAEGDGEVEATSTHGDETEQSSSASTSSPATIDDIDLTVLDELDEGSGGKIFTATWGHTVVAVKVCHTGRPDENTAKQLIEEATILKKISHPNVLQLLGIVISGTCVKMVTELMDTSLYKRMFDSPTLPKLTKAEKYRIALGILSGTAHLHSKHIVHTDLKLENVLISANIDSVKICDFGLARIKTTQGVTKIKGTPAGTPMYKAPEMFFTRGKKTLGNFSTHVGARWSLDRALH